MGRWSQSSYGRVPDMLLYDGRDASEFKGSDPDRRSTPGIPYLLEFCQDIKQNPVRLTRLLVWMAKADLGYVLLLKNPICAIDLRNIIEVVKRYCLGNDGVSHVRDSLELAELLAKWRDRLVYGWDLSEAVEGYLMRETIEPEELTMQCTQVIHGLLAPRVTRFGLQASRSIACARPVVAADAATRWLRMYL
jgi:hypothetical protein